MERAEETKERICYYVTMKILFWSLLACSSMRYSACQAVNIGDACSAEQAGELECTPLPSSVFDDDCNEYFLEDHIVAQCQKIDEHYQWQPIGACRDGLYCITNGQEYECDQSQVADCQWSDGEFWDTDSELN